MSRTHCNTTEICIGKAQIDMGILPVVNWLNSFGSVYTLHSCEGGYVTKSADNSPIYHAPYVSFLCTDSYDLDAIIQKILDFHKVHSRTEREIGIECTTHLLAKTGVAPKNVLRIYDCIGGLGEYETTRTSDILGEFVKYITRYEDYDNE